jgi:hypothetical protein
MKLKEEIANINKQSEEIAQIREDINNLFKEME